MGFRTTGPLSRASSRGPLASASSSKSLSPDPRAQLERTEASLGEAAVSPGVEFEISEKRCQRQQQRPHQQGPVGGGVPRGVLVGGGRQVFFLLRQQQGALAFAILRQLQPEEYLSVVDEAGCSLLHWAALCGDLNCLELLLNAGASREGECAVGAFGSLSLREGAVLVSAFGCLASLQGPAWMPWLGTVSKRL